MRAYCIFCRTGSEKQVAQRINQTEKNMQAVAPVRVMHEKRQGRWREHEKILLPGYVFVYMEQLLEAYKLKRIKDLYKVLRYDGLVKELAGTDQQYAMWLHRYGGSIQSSKVLKVGNQVTVVDGPLIDAIGKIKMMDRKKRRVWVEFEFDGVVRTVALSAECLGERQQKDA